MSPYICRMEMTEQKLVTIKTYSEMIKKSTTWVYKLIEKREVKIKEIDGVKFVILP